MVVRRSVARVVGVLVFPAICGAAIAYFGYFTVWGERGLVALASGQTQLAAEQEQYDALRTARERLQHRIDLLNQGDPDMVQEVRRNQLLGAETGEVLVPRKHGTAP
jgi:cell division protein FtsB